MTAASTSDPTLGSDRHLPRYDFVVVHAGVFPALPDECYRAAHDLDLPRDLVIRTLLGLRSLPQRLADRVRRRDAGADASRTLRLDDMVGLPLG